MSSLLQCMIVLAIVFTAAASPPSPDPWQTLAGADLVAAGAHLADRDPSSSILRRECPEPDRQGGVCHVMR